MEKNQSLQLLGGSAQGLQQELTGGEEGHGISRLGSVGLSLSVFFFFAREGGETEERPEKGAGVLGLFNSTA